VKSAKYSGSQIFRYFILSSVLLLCITACALPLSSHAPSEQVYRLAPQVGVMPQRALAHVYLPRLQVSPALDTSRITLVRPGFQQDFIANSRWPDSLGVYLHAVMLDALSRSEGFLSVSDQLLSNNEVYKLLLRVSAFHVEYPPSGQGRAAVVVGLEAILVREQDQRMLGQYRADIRKENTQISTSKIVEALNQALGEGMTALITDMATDLPILR
jgi:ABC-type uncharacterized transport system auxiliary subunit